MKNIITIVLLTLFIKSYTQNIIIGKDTIYSNNKQIKDLIIDNTFWKNNLDLTKDNFCPAYPPRKLWLNQEYKWTGDNWIKLDSCEELKIELQFWKDKYNQLLYESKKLKIANKKEEPKIINDWVLKNPFDTTTYNIELFKQFKDSIIFQLNNNKFKMYKDSTGLNNHIYLIKD